VIEKQLDIGVKAVVIQVSDIFYNMGVEEIPEDYPEDKEFEAHVKTINQVIQKARREGYRKYLLLNHKEAEAKGQDIGINGVYLLILKR
jgi:hypothetical protein